mmetsp:Transcript_12101/g.21588  ORF Transcript_12101/g.21588 Transcript_12101/m.21588 type:complete len:218 (+) Transcript_12101:389-1042(+)
MLRTLPYKTLPSTASSIACLLFKLETARERSTRFNLRSSRTTSTTAQGTNRPTFKYAEIEGTTPSASELCSSERFSNDRYPVKPPGSPILARFSLTSITRPRAFTPAESVFPFKECTYLIRDSSIFSMFSSLRLCFLFSSSVSLSISFSLWGSRARLPAVCCMSTSSSSVGLTVNKFSLSFGFLLPVAADTFSEPPLGNDVIFTQIFHFDLTSTATH